MSPPTLRLHDLRRDQRHFGRAAWGSNESGRDEIYVQAWPGPGGRWGVSTDGGRFPRWSADGRELYYRNGDRMMIVAVKDREEADFGRPQVLFTSDHYQQGFALNFDVALDGQTFVLVDLEEPRASRIQVVQGWFAELVNGV